MMWYVGQHIVAIKNSKCGGIKKNQDFIIKGISYSNCCSRTLLDVGLIQPSHYFVGQYLRCSNCGGVVINDTIKWKLDILFAPIDFDISELTEILEEPILKQKEDKQ